jgi:hypothetical protein
MGWLADTPPQVSLTRPVTGTVFGDGQPVTADYACAATDHAIASCVGTVADGAAVNTAVAGTYDFSVTATDVAGYQTTRTGRYTVVDDDKPAVGVTVPADGLVVARGAALTADFSCADDAGGPLLDGDACEGSIDDGQAIDTTVLGDHPFTVTATDPAGNQTTWTGTYTVAGNRPDVLVRTLTRARYGGGNVYSPDGLGQTVQGVAGPSQATGFWMRVENDGRATDSFRLRGSPPRRGWTVRWYAGGQDVTAAMQAGTYRVDDLAPGESRLVRVVVRPTRSGTGRQTVTLAAIGGPRRDAVRAIVARR